MIKLTEIDGLWCGDVWVNPQHIVHFHRDVQGSQARSILYLVGRSAPLRVTESPSVVLKLLASHKNLK